MKTIQLLERYGGYHNGPNPTQLKLHQATQRIKVLCGPPRTGKSIGAQMEVILWCLRNPGVPFACFRQTYKEVYEHVAMKFIEMAKRLCIFDRFTHVSRSNITEESVKTLESDTLWIHVGRGRRSPILFRNLDERDKYRGGGYGGAYLDDIYGEKHHITQEDVDFIDTRISEPSDCALLLMTMNPPDQRYWAYQRYWPQADHPAAPNVLFLQTAPFENRAHLRAGYFEEVAEGKSESWKRINIHGQPGVEQSGASCVPAFDAARQVRPDVVDPTQALIRGWDFGERNTFVLFGQVLRHESDLRIAWQHELMLEGHDIDQAAAVVKAQTAAWYPLGMEIRDYGDPAGKSVTQAAKGRSCISILHEDHGITVQSVASNRTETNIETRLTGMNRLCREQVGSWPKLMCWPDTVPVLVSALGGGYHRDAHGRPRKDGYFDHPVDAAGYWLEGAVWGAQRAAVQLTTPRPISTRMQLRRTAMAERSVRA